MLTYSPPNGHRGLSTPDAFHQREILGVEGNFKCDSNFVTTVDENEIFKNFENQSIFEPKTAVTSEIRAGELFTGFIDPADVPWRREIHPCFKRGRYGFHKDNTRSFRSRHQILLKMDLEFDLMTTILIELARNRQKYNAEKLSRILKGQFGAPKPIHKRAWINFNKKYDQLDLEASITDPSYAENVQDIIKMSPKPLIIDKSNNYSFNKLA